MKLLGFEITLREGSNKRDLTPRYIQKRPAKVPIFKPHISKPTLEYEKTQRRGQFKEVEWDLPEIGRLATTESYFSRSIRIKNALLNKEGWDIVGANPRNVRYIKSRIKELEVASGIPFELLMWRTSSDLIQYSNAMWVKVRNEKCSSGRSRRVGNKKNLLEPVAAYFPVPVEAVEFDKSDKAVRQYKQAMPDGSERIWSADDVVHFYYDKKNGFMIGTPTILPVMEDIRILRKMEEDVALLLHKHLFPLFHYIVGTEKFPADIDSNGNKEVEIVRDAVQEIPSDGCIFTSERHEVRAIGAESKAIRAEGYLEFLKQRVFAGLGVSAVDMGEGGTANRSTSDTLSRAAIDNVKDYQRVMEWFINFSVIYELLDEAPFPVGSLQDEKNRVYFQYKEIDTDSQIKRETHASQMWMQNLITLAEAREIMGREEMSEEDWKDTYWHKILRAKTILQAVDEPGTEAAKNQAKNQISPTNQHGTKTGPSPKQDFLEDLFITTEDGKIDIREDKLVKYLETLDNNLETVIMSDIDIDVGNYIKAAKEKISILQDLKISNISMYRMAIESIVDTFLSCKKG